MVNALCDTAVLVDLLRERTAAVEWIATQTEIAVTTIVWLEMLEGVQNKNDLRVTLKLLNQFEMIETTPADMQGAIEHLTQFKLSHGVDMMDCMIAAVSYRLQLPVFTQNLKHFRPLLGELAQRPYST